MDLGLCPVQGIPPRLNTISIVWDWDHWKSECYRDHYLPSKCIWLPRKPHRNHSALSQAFSHWTNTTIIVCMFMCWVMQNGLVHAWLSVTCDMRSPEVNIFLRSHFTKEDTDVWEVIIYPRLQVVNSSMENSLVDPVSGPTHILRILMEAGQLPGRGAALPVTCSGELEPVLSCLQGFAEGHGWRAALSTCPQWPSFWFLCSLHPASA